MKKTPLSPLTEEDEEEHPVIKGVMSFILGTIAGLAILYTLFLFLTHGVN